MHRVQRVLTAMKRAEMSRVGARVAAAAAARSAADDLRARVHGAALPESAAEMMALGQWQRGAEARARAYEAEAAEIDHEVAELKAGLARTMGREAAVTGLVERTRAAARRQAEARAETVPVRPSR